MSTPNADKIRAAQITDEPAPVGTRDQIRAKIFETRPQTKKRVPFFGTQIEIRQPTLHDILSAQSKEDREEAIIDMLLAYAYVPDTEEKVFDEADRDGLKAQPFGQDFIRVSAALAEMTNVDFGLPKPVSG